MSWSRFKSFFFQLSELIFFVNQFLNRKQNQKEIKFWKKKKIPSTFGIKFK